MDRELAKLDKKIQKRLLRASLRAAASYLRKDLRRQIRSTVDRRSGDLLRALTVAVRTSRKGYIYALVAFRYGKYGDPSRTSQDPGVYAAFLSGGATRAKRVGECGRETGASGPP